MTVEAYRDATYSDSTQEKLRDLLAYLTTLEGWNTGPRGQQVHALTDVIERWDANAATEIIVTVEPTLRAVPS